MAWWHGYAALWAAVLSLGLPHIVDFVRTFRPPAPSAAVCACALGYVILLAALSAVLPGTAQRGALLADGKTRLTYVCNGLGVALAAVAMFIGFVYSGVLPGGIIADHVPQLFVVGNAVSVALSAYLFVEGRSVLAAQRRENSGGIVTFLHDFVLGTTLNPTLARVDLKFFSYRPAMTGWLLINISFALKQYEVLGSVTLRMALYQALTGWYVIDYFVNEPKMVFTWDIIAENFGFMLVWADYVFIPFAFSVQNFFLLEDKRSLSVFEAGFIIAIFALGFMIFRGANSQKHQFKTNPSALIWGRPPQVVGNRLLASGYWGVARHFNYTGDLMLALSYCMPCGSNSPLAYFYFFYLLLLVVHREKRDDERCAAKYNTDWEEYCNRVPYRMLPFVY